MGLSIVAVTINCRDPRSLAEWWAETLDEGEITQDLGEYVFVHAGRVELGFQGVAAGRPGCCRRRAARVGAAGHGVDGAARSGGQRLLRFSQRHDHSGVRAASVVGPDVAGKDGLGDRITCLRSDIALLTTTSTRWYMEDAELLYRGRRFNAVATGPSR